VSGVDVQRCGPGPGWLASLWAVGLATIALFLPAVAAADPPEPEPYQQGDGLGFRNILPPGSNGFANLADIAAFQLTGAQPKNFDDQLGPYARLLYGAPGLTTAELDRYFKDASFGVPSAQVERTYSPRDDVTIVRDRFGVPHIYGATRSGAIFGIGYATAEDRLFFIDILRHAGRAQLSSFAGGANVQMDREVWAETPYTEEDLQLQFDLGDDVYGAVGAQLQEDALNYTDGVNAYIAEARLNPLKMPGEYAAINQPLGPSEWKVTDLISIASLVGGIFGKGGGAEVGSALVLEEARERFGHREGKRIWADFRNANDPEAPTTVHGQRFPYQTVPDHPRGRALPDPGTTDAVDVVVGSGAGADPSGLDGLLEQLRGLSMSNALLVSARESQSGRPLAVMGPQVAYFAPQILMEQDVHAPATPDGPALAARGTAFPGSNVYVQLGRGPDYAWSATSANQDIIDTFALRLCEQDGSAPTIESMSYRFRGECLPFEVLERTNTWLPSAADQTPPGTETLRALRSKMGIVSHRAMIKGHPYAYTKLRRTYFHEVDSARGFADLNNPDAISGPEDFQRAAHKIDFTFNWFYADDRQIAYFNSGANPVRPDHVDQGFPVFGRRANEWEGWDPELNFADATPFAAHPQTIDQRYITSWNNKQARAYSAADGDFRFGPIYRSDPLDDRIRAEIAGAGKMSLVELVSAMEDAATVDLRGDAVLPWILEVLRTRPVDDPALAEALDELRAWNRAGAHRRDLDRDGHYEHTGAIRTMDAWWPRLLRAEFEPTLGEELYDAIEAVLEIDDTDRRDHLGSAFSEGWYGFVHKDLRQLLGEPVRGANSRVYCGKGSLGRCHRVLLRSLAQALAHDSDAELYPDGPCGVGDAQMCFETLIHRPTGGIEQPQIPWQNRPTFQQVVEVQGPR
jgi:acyl-homoserine lactone acylase PvdQ